jgi:hypothetical protein
MNYAKRLVGIAIGVPLAFFVFLAPLRAQEDSSSERPKDEQPKPAAKTSPLTPDGVADDTQTPPPSEPPNPYAGVIKDAGTGLPLFGTSSTPLRWGDFSISSFEYFGILDQFEPPGGANQEPWTNLSILRTGLMFDHFISRTKSRIVLQYFPQLAIVGGQVHANVAANNNLSLGTQFNISPRLSITVQDSFLQVHSNPLIPENFFAADSRAGSVTQNNFLETNGNFLADTATATIQYAFSPRTTITITPLYRYERTTSTQPGSLFVADGQTYSGTIAIGHALTPRRSIGVFDSFQYLKEKSTAVPQSARYNTSGFYYSEQLNRSLWVTGQIGAEWQSFSDLPQGNHWGYSGGFSVLKNVPRNISLAAAYTRGITFNNYVSRKESDRVDGSIGVLFTRRTSWNSTVGYFRELGVTPRTNGKYVTTEFDYRFAGNFSLFTTFAYTYQNNNAEQLFAGQRKTIVFGIRWRPPLRPGL